MDDTEQPSDAWMTLREAAARTGHTKDAIRQRVRRRSLRATKGNDGVVRVSARDLADLPPPDAFPDATTDDHGQAHMDALAATLDGLRTTLDKTMDNLGHTRSALDAARADHLVAHGRAERAEAEAAASRTRAEAAEARAANIELALSEARIPWAVKIIRAVRGRGT